MVPRLEGSTGFSGRPLRLSTLVRLRWLAVAGQALAVVVVDFWFGFPMPTGWCLLLIALSAWLNIALRIRFPSTLRVDPNWATALLAYDILQLAGLLYLTGGLQNPFSILLLSPVTVSATTLAPDKTFLLGGLALAAATALIFVHQPLPWFPGRTFTAPLHYLGGVWVALVSSLIFIAFYAFRVAEEARQLSNALAAAELVLQREQHLSALDGLAAAAAHELGTPLATIALVAKELDRELPPGDPHGEDVRLILSQSQRCREILSKLTSLGAGAEEHLGRMPLSHLLEEVIAPHRNFGIQIEVALDGAGPEPVTARNPGVIYGLGNLVENAVDFAESTVGLVASWSDAGVAIEITDDGPGFAPEIIDRIGEPYVTTRLGEGPVPTGEHGGLGLGFFIAKTLIERSGARLSLENRRGAQSGAVVTVTWARRDFEGLEEAKPLRNEA
ncbi:ActS/PrrB/RegB family redox-sensitive histidine kinase [Propylenella binzhouense]|uniref:histidine kinase n=1 Tax=Propylenella binzhouense TaxID=2555902 RepID=A0A964TAG7_9HYPH|nr:ActS/PrrB/RegB family redox-sensitive histidine kinase [Propylenella binzhouense]MYZ50277.1 ActS/PrrB/RegB family redox-sensitive histidine kinase [Propylenella binzhouense]